MIPPDFHETLLLSKLRPPSPAGHQFRYEQPLHIQSIQQLEKFSIRRKARFIIATNLTPDHTPTTTPDTSPTNIASHPATSVPQEPDLAIITHLSSTNSVSIDGEQASCASVGYSGSD
ncbi:MAG: hypothetical protein ACREBR_00040, partial [bacterium]